jgi:hypothetical protein
VKVFGVGCIYFGYEIGDEIPDAASGRDAFLTDLRSRLEKVENISDVIFHGVGDVPYGNVAVVKKGEREIAVPLAHGGVRLEFNMFLPFRVQDTIHGRCDVEMMHVDVIYGYELPVAVVSYEWPDEEGDATPSDAVIVARKFLQKKLTDDRFQCDCIGPSPFHANFYLVQPDLEETIRIEDVSVDRLAYASLELMAPRGMSLDTAFRLANLDTIFSKFYKLSELRSRLIHSQVTIIESSRELLEEQAPSGYFRRLRAAREQGKTVDTLNAQVFREMLLRLDMSNVLAKTDQLEIAGSENPMERFFAEHRVMSSEEGWTRFSEVAKFFEDRRQKTIGNFTAISAGVLGGVIGSVIGSVATYLLTASA